MGDKEKDKKIAKRFGKGYVVFIIIMMCFPIAMLVFSGIQMFKFQNSGINFFFEQYQGTQYGWDVRHILDKVITHNKTNDYIVTVIYNDNTATTEDEIVAIKYQIPDSVSEEYEISIGYDKKGRANKITIKDIKQ